MTDPFGAGPPARAGNRTFTALSPADNGTSAAPVEHSHEMETAGRLLFVGLVTCYLLGRVFAGPAAPVEVVVYGMTAAFGLEYLMASWRVLWPGR
jgi:hypothetical protein